MAKMLKRIAPVGIGLLLILLITVTVSLVKSANDRTPGILKADDVYASYEDYDVTYDKLYTYMKNKYGVTELLNMIDEKLFAEDIKKVDVTKPEYKEYVNEQVFGNKDIAEVDEKEAQKKWEEIIDSLRVTGLLTKAQATDRDYKHEDSEAWKVVKDFYKIAYAREEWAKQAYIEKVKENNDGKLFDVTIEENSKNSIEKYFEDNYSGNVTGFFIPFTSEDAALAMMKKHGINTLDKVLSSNDGWVSKDYNYYDKEKVEESDMLTNKQVVEAFFGMYNEVYGYLNGGNEIIKADSYETVLKEGHTAQAGILALQKSLEEKKFGVELTLPTTINVDGEDKATITWSVENDKYATIENSNKLVGKFESSDDGELNVKLQFEVKFKEATAKGSISIELKGTLNESNGKYESIKDAVLTIEEPTVKPFYAHELKADFIKNNEEKFKFSWNYKEAEEINATLASYLSINSTKLTLSEKPSEFYKSYTIEPVKVGNYYFLIIKLTEKEIGELFEKNADGEVQKDDKGNYKVLNQELYDEIVAKMTEELLTDNAIDEMIYEKRVKHNVKIFDSYLEALYEYEYKNFYETTLKQTDYKKFKKAKKNQKKVIVSLQTEAGNKKSTVKIEAQELFNRLEKKYSSNALSTLVENYILINDKVFNNIYNPYTKEILNETSYKNLMKSEVNTLRKNFESNYFTYSYLAYYGFTPNFPAKYGWKKFIKDYFVAESDEDLLTVSTYGGTIYAEALKKYTDTLYDYEDVLAEMQKQYDNWYSVSVINLIISIDYNYNANDGSEKSAEILLEEKENWESGSTLAEEQKVLAKELGSLMYELAVQTNAGSLADQMAALVTLYNDAAYEYNEDDWNTARSNNTSVYDFNYFGKYKLKGLNVKFEKANNYDSTSQIMKPFADECRKIWKEAEKLDLLDTTFDVPLVCDEAFFTDYGYHMIAVLGANSKDELPSKEEIEIFRAQKEIDEIQKAIDEAKKNIDKYKESGYNTDTYYAEIDYKEAKKAEYVNELKEILKKQGKEENYKQDEETLAKLNKWYVEAEKKLEGGTLVTRSYIKTLTDNMSKFTFANANGEENLKEFLGLLLEQCDKADKEEESK